MTCSLIRYIFWEQNGALIVRGFIVIVSVYVIQFLQERLEIAKYSCRGQIHIFATLINKCLLLNVGKQPAVISRHPAAIGPRLRYTDH